MLRHGHGECNEKPASVLLSLIWPFEKQDYLSWNETSRCATWTARCCSAVRVTSAIRSLNIAIFEGHEEPLLAMPDAIAWCWQRSGEWRHRIRELVTEVRKL